MHNKMKVWQIINSTTWSVNDALTVKNIFSYGRYRQDLVVAYSWAAVGGKPVPQDTARQAFPWVVQRLLREQMVVLAHLDELPDAAARDRDSFREREIRSNLALPLVAGDQVIGALDFATVTAERAWPDELVRRLQLVTEVFANDFAR